MAFYADFLGEQDSFSKGKDYHHSRKHVNFYVGDAKIKLRLWVTSEEEHLGIVTTQCSSSKCMVPDRWNYFDSSKVEGNQFSSNFEEQVELFNGQYITRILYTGNFMQDNLRIQFLQGTPKDFDCVFYGIIDSGQEYWSDYSGYVGLAPYSASLPIQEQQLNMMNNLVLNG